MFDDSCGGRLAGWQARVYAWRTLRCTRSLLQRVINIGLHSNFPISEPTKKRPLSRNFAKIAENLQSRGAQKIRRETKLPKNHQKLLSWRGHKIPASKKMTKIAEWEGT
jgi:hypothetical protein